MDLLDKIKVQNSEDDYHNPEECRDPDCVQCQRRKPFDMPPEIIDAYKRNELLLFTGSGISTENKSVFPKSFYYNIAHELGVLDDNLSFPSLMTLLTSPPRSRKDLILEIKKRIDTVNAFPELFGCATEFHRELATIPNLTEIVTTNWDDYFEKMCDATPIVTGEDYAVFQDIPGRKVFKIHGSISNYGSIIATEEDYEKCYEQLNRGIIGAKLKLLLISKTVVYIGYSLDDEDFRKIYQLLQEDTKGLMPHAYLVTLDEDAQKKLDLYGINITPIITDGVYFISELKKQLVSENLMMPDTNYDGVYEALSKVLTEHRKLYALRLKDHPDAIYSLVYQDGLQHAFSRILNTMNSGLCSDYQYVVNVIEKYEEIIKGCRSVGNYPDVAYFTGYRNGWIFFLDVSARPALPLYYLFKCENIQTFEEFIEKEKQAPDLHKAAHRTAKKMIKNIKSDNVAYHRIPV